MQIGTPEQLFETPAHRFVGHFIGSPGMNFLACEWTAGAATLAGVRVETQQHAGAARRASLCRSACGPNISSSLRRRARIACRCAIAAIQDQGIHTMVRLEVGAPSSSIVRVGEAAHLERCAARWARHSRACRRRAARCMPTSGGSHELRAKPVNQRAWWFVLPVLISVAFSARHAADDGRQLLGAGHLSARPGACSSAWSGTRRCCATPTCTARCYRQLVFTAAVLAIEIPLGIALALAMPASAAGARRSCWCCSRCRC